MVGLNAGNGAKRLALPVHSLFSDSFPATANSSVVRFWYSFYFCNVDICPVGTEVRISEFNGNLITQF